MQALEEAAGAERRPALASVSYTEDMPVAVTYTCPLNDDLPPRERGWPDQTAPESGECLPTMVDVRTRNFNTSKRLSAIVFYQLRHVQTNL